MKTLKFIFIFLFTIQFIFSQEYTTTVEILNEKNNPVKEKIEQNLSKILNTLTESSFSNIKQIKLDNNISSQDGINSINELWSNRKFRTAETELLVYLSKRHKETKYEVRDIPLIQLDDNGTVVYQNGVFTFTSSGKLEDVKFGLPEKDYKQILKTGIGALEESRRLVILDFIENFRTAYDRKDLKYIESVFSNDAIIIVGKVITKEKGGIKLEGNVEDQKVELVKFSKKEYIDKLGVTFKRNSFIKLKFDTIEVTQSRMNQHFYAVNLIQEWRSSSYEDKGYLFVLIDFTIEEKPLIHVRAWEPYKQTIKNQRIVIGDFDVN